MRTITADDLAAVWPRPTVVDVRGTEEHAIAHIPGSLNIPLDELPRLKDLPDATVHLLCSGKRSSQAAMLLAERGYNTMNVAGGITEWYRNGHPVTYAAPPANLSRPAGGAHWRIGS
jgi:rhodanese-related sulfurtransferase